MEPLPSMCTATAKGSPIHDTPRRSSLVLSGPSVIVPRPSSVSRRQSIQFSLEHANETTRQTPSKHYLSNHKPIHSCNSFDEHASRSEPLYEVQSTQKKSCSVSSTSTRELAKWKLKEITERRKERTRASNPLVSVESHSVFSPQLLPETISVGSPTRMWLKVESTGGVPSARRSSHMFVGEASPLVPSLPALPTQPAREPRQGRRQRLLMISPYLRGMARAVLTADTSQFPELAPPTDEKERKFFQRVPEVLHGHERIGRGPSVESLRAVTTAINDDRPLSPKAFRQFQAAVLVNRDHLQWVKRDVLLSDTILGRMLSWTMHIESLCHDCSIALTSLFPYIKALHLFLLQLWEMLEVDAFISNLLVKRLLEAIEKSVLEAAGECMKGVAEELATSPYPSLMGAAHQQQQKTTESHPPSPQPQEEGEEPVGLSDRVRATNSAPPILTATALDLKLKKENQARRSIKAGDASAEMPLSSLMPAPPPLLTSNSVTSGGSRTGLLPSPPPLTIPTLSTVLGRNRNYVTKSSSTQGSIASLSFSSDFASSGGWVTEAEPCSPTRLVSPPRRRAREAARRRARSSQGRGTPVPLPQSGQKQNGESEESNHQDAVLYNRPTLLANAKTKGGEDEKVVQKEVEKMDTDGSHVKLYSPSTDGAHTLHPLASLSSSIEDSSVDAERYEDVVALESLSEALRAQMIGINSDLVIHLAHLKWLIAALMKEGDFDVADELEDEEVQRLWIRQFGRSTPGCLVEEFEVTVLRGFPEECREALMLVANHKGAGVVSIHSIQRVLKVWGPLPCFASSGLYSDLSLPLFSLTESFEFYKEGLLFRPDAAPGDFIVTLTDKPGEVAVVLLRSVELEGERVKGFIPPPPSFQESEGESEQANENPVVSSERVCALEAIFFSFSHRSGAWSIERLSYEGFETIGEACAAYPEVFSRPCGTVYCRPQAEPETAVEGKPPTVPAQLPRTASLLRAASLHRPPGVVSPNPNPSAAVDSALHRACFRYNEMFVKSLLDRGANALVNVGLVDPSIDPNFCWTPLLCAVNNPYADPITIVEALLANGADPTIDDDAQCTPLYYAIMRQYTGSVRLLLQHSPTLRSSPWTHPLLLALGPHHFYARVLDVQLLAHYVVKSGMIETVVASCNDYQLVRLAIEILQNALNGKVFRNCEPTLRLVSSPWSGGSSPLPPGSPLTYWVEDDEEVEEAVEKAEEKVMEEKPGEDEDEELFDDAELAYNYYLIDYEWDLLGLPRPGRRSRGMGRRDRRAFNASRSSSKISHEAAPLSEQGGVKPASSEATGKHFPAASDDVLQMDFMAYLYPDPSLHELRTPEEQRGVDRIVANYVLHGVEDRREALTALRSLYFRSYFLSVRDRFRVQPEQK